MSFQVHFFKDRQKFSSAHFTLFADGEVERLHGHNYYVEVTLEGPSLEHGLLFPFHEVKPIIGELCNRWDERVLLPTQAEWITLTEAGEGVKLALRTPRVSKDYLFPIDDVAYLPCNNISSENLAALLLEDLGQRLKTVVPSMQSLQVSVSESAGQEVIATQRVADRAWAPSRGDGVGFAGRP